MKNKHKTHLHTFCRFCGVFIDQLFRTAKIKTDGKNKDMHLWRRFSKIEKLDPKEKRQIMMLLDTFIE